MQKIMIWPLINEKILLSTQLSKLNIDKLTSITIAVDP